MRRLLTSVTAVPILVLILAAPAAAAPPVKDSGTQQFFSAFSFTCGPSTCTDTFIDVFTVSEDLVVVCTFESTFNIRSGRIVSEDGACSEELSSDVLVIADDLSSASLAPTDVTFFTCTPQGCVEGETITVSADLTASGPIFTDRSRSTFSDGTCTVTISQSGEQRQASGTITIDGETLSAEGNIGVGTFSFMERCR